LTSGDGIQDRNRAKPADVVAAVLSCVVNGEMKIMTNAMAELKKILSIDPGISMLFEHGIYLCQQEKLTEAARVYEEVLSFIRPGPKSSASWVIYISRQGLFQGRRSAGARPVALQEPMTS